MSAVLRRVMKTVLAEILGGQILSEDAAATALRQILSNEIPIAQTSSFLATIALRGVALSELRGFHRVLLEQSKLVDLRETELIDVCGTGGDGKQTFNISTLAAFVLAGAGVKVAKHGNASATSGCGSSDVLQFLGAEFTNDESFLREQLNRANICYLHAPLFQPALKNLASLRREIGFRTFFNLLGVLLNPARPRFQLIGVAEPFAMRLYRYFLEDSSTKFALVHSRDGYDEISLTGAFDAITNRGGSSFYPEDLDFASVDASEITSGETIESAAKTFLQILAGKGTRAQTNVVIANAAFALNLIESDFKICRARAAESLLSGKAMRAFENLIQTRAAY